MHSPKYFLGLLAIASSMTLSVNAGPIHQREASLPEFYQPIAEPVPLVQSRIASFGASTVDHAGAKTVATKLISTGVGIDSKDIQISHSHYSVATGLHHVYLTQTHNGLPIVNAVSNVHVEASGDVLSAHHSFAPASIVKSAPVRRGAPPVSLEQAVLKYAAAKGLKTTDKLQVAEKGKNDYAVMGASFAVAPIRGSQKYYQTGSKLIPVWDVNVQLSNVWQNFFVNSESGEIVAVANWTIDYIPDSDSAVPAQVPVARRDAPSLIARAGQILDALYNVIPIGRNNPQSNNGLTKVRSPWNTNASPNGWHFTQNQQTFDLTGNNVFAQSNPNNIQDINQLVALPRPSSNSLTFDYPFDPTKDEKNANNRDAATTNMFYVANACHDIFYQYGFTEAAGNFQNENFGKGGSENDPVIANSQDGSGTNNANFATGPDGYAGLMRMYVFTPSGVPARDGALENDIIIHEMGHGLSTRLTGGAATANCLNSLISGGMGEGWSDFVGYTLSLPTAFTRNSDYAFGDWAAHGYRKPYSTSLTRNTMAYSNLASLNEVHAIGQVWAEFLWEALWNLIDQAGMTPAADLAISQDAGTGNTALLKIVIEGMKIQPCNPTFVSARDAILTAESKLYGGKFKCGLWTAFAKRGLGTKAVAGTYRDSFDLPAECSNQPPKTTTTTVAVVKTTTAPVVVKTTTTAAPVVTTTAVPVITTKKVVTTTKAGTTVTVGQPCTNFGQWACNNSVQCSYGASGSLEWIALVAGVQGC